MVTVPPLIAASIPKQQIFETFNIPFSLVEMELSKDKTGIGKILENGSIFRPFRGPDFHSFAQVPALAQAGLVGFGPERRRKRFIRHLAHPRLDRVTLFSHLVSSRPSLVWRGLLQV
jgi:hypothetical protein